MCTVFAYLGLNYFGGITWLISNSLTELDFKNIEEICNRLNGSSVCKIYGNKETI